MPPNQAKRSASQIQDEIKKARADLDLFKSVDMPEGMRNHHRQALESKIKELTEELEGPAKRAKLEESEVIGCPKGDGDYTSSGSSDEDEGGSGGSNGEWAPSEATTQMTNSWYGSPLMLALQTLQLRAPQSNRKSKTDAATKSLVYNGQTFEQGHCYLYRGKQETEDLVVGITGFRNDSVKSEIPMADCVLVVPFGWTFLGYKLERVDYEARYKPSEFLQITVPLEPLSLDKLGDKFLPHPTIPEWQHEPPMRGSAYNFAYSKQGRRNLLGLRKDICLEELFAGCGGMAQGFKESGGFKVVLAVEKNPKAAAAYRKNHHESPMECMDVRDLDSLKENDQKDRDHIHGSAPCQGFSQANSSGGKNDKKNNDLSLVWMERVLTKRPVTASYENVVGIWDAKNQPYLRRMVDDLMGRSGYQVRVCMLRACDYGDPQNRPRIFIFCAQQGAYLPSVPKPTHGPGADLPYVSVKDALEGLALEEKDALPFEPTKDNTDKDKVRLRADEPTRTLLASHEPPLHYRWNRALTVKETSRLFSYPVGYEFVGRRKDQVRQIGNSVPVRLACAVADAFKAVLRYRYESEQPSYIG